MEFAHIAEFRQNAKRVFDRLPVTLDRTPSLLNTTPRRPTFTPG